MKNATTLATILAGCLVAGVSQHAFAQHIIEITNDDDSVTVRKSRAVKQSQAKPAHYSVTPDTNIRLFTINGCMYCRQSKAYLDDRAIDYVEYNTSMDEGADALAALHLGKGVPLLVVGSSHIRGFSEDRYDDFFRKIRH